MDALNFLASCPFAGLCNLGDKSKMKKTLNCFGHSLYHYNNNTGLTANVIQLFIIPANFSQLFLIVCISVHEKRTPFGCPYILLVLFLGTLN